MEDELTKICEYLVLELKRSMGEALAFCKRFKAHPDICMECASWVETKSFPDDGVKVSGYSAADIFKMAPFLDGIGVYIFLMDLVDEPDKAQKCIDNEFKLS